MALDPRARSRPGPGGSGRDGLEPPAGEGGARSVLLAQRWGLEAASARGCRHETSRRPPSRRRAAARPRQAREGRGAWSPGSSTGAYPAGRGERGPSSRGPPAPGRGPRPRATASGDLRTGAGRREAPRPGDPARTPPRARTSVEGRPERPRPPPRPRGEEGGPRGTRVLRAAPRPVPSDGRAGAARGPGATLREPAPPDVEADGRTPPSTSPSPDGIPARRGLGPPRRPRRPPREGGGGDGGGPGHRPPPPAREPRGHRGPERRPSPQATPRRARGAPGRRPSSPPAPHRGGGRSTHGRRRVIAPVRGARPPPSLGTEEGAPRAGGGRGPGPSRDPAPWPRCPRCGEADPGRDGRPWRPPRGGEGPGATAPRRPRTRAGGGRGCLVGH